MLGFLSEIFLKGKWENLFILSVAGSRGGGLGGDLIKALSFWSLNLPMDSQFGREEKVFLIQGRSLHFLALCRWAVLSVSPQGPETMKPHDLGLKSLSQMSQNNQVLILVYFSRSFDKEIENQHKTKIEICLRKPLLWAVNECKATALGWLTSHCHASVHHTLL